MRLIDSHSHLFLEEFAEDLPQVMARAREAGARAAARHVPRSHAPRLAPARTPTGRGLGAYVWSHTRVARSPRHGVEDAALHVAADGIPCDNVRLTNCLSAIDFYPIHNLLKTNMLRNTVQKAVFRVAKGGLSLCKRRPFAL